jgi:hypothetical protein
VVFALLIRIRLRNHSHIVTVDEKPVVLKWDSDDNNYISGSNFLKNPSNTPCAPCDQCDPKLLPTKQKSEVSISDDITSLEEETEKDPGFMRSHRAHRSQPTDLTENSFKPIVSVEDFFKVDPGNQSSALPDHSLEQSPCYPIIGSTTLYPIYNSICNNIRCPGILEHTILTILTTLTNATIRIKSFCRLQEYLLIYNICNGCYSSIKFKDGL